MRLIAENVAAERGGESVFSGLGFSLGSGQALVVTGPNGAGKSTLLRVIAGFLPMSAGSVRLEGKAPDVAISQACHYLGHQNAMKTQLTVSENLEFWRAFLVDPQHGIEKALDLVGLPDIDHLPYGTLSTGQRRRVAIARLLVSRRPVWLLDEPTSGLDAASEARFSDLMAEHLRGGGMIVAATHLPLGLGDAVELKMGR